MTAPDAPDEFVWDVYELAALGRSFLGSAVGAMRLGHENPVNSLPYLHSDQTEWNVDFLIDYLRMCGNDKQARDRVHRFLVNSGAEKYVMNDTWDPRGSLVSKAAR